MRRPWPPRRGMTAISSHCQAPLRLVNSYHAARSSPALGRGQPPVFRSDQRAAYFGGSSPKEAANDVPRLCICSCAGDLHHEHAADGEAHGRRRPISRARRRIGLLRCRHASKSVRTDTVAAWPCRPTAAGCSSGADHARSSDVIGFLVGQIPTASPMPAP